jgi:DNA-binding transcriptional LysR family regulator
MEGVLGSPRTAPTGLVRIGTNVSGALLLTPRLLGLLERHVGLEVELVVRDRLDDMINERLDVAMQLGQPTDSSVMARKAGAFGRMLVAAPVYLERRGAPKRPADLLGHTCILHESGPDGALWQFDGPQGVEEIRVNASFRANNAEAVHRAVLAGYGIAKVSEALVVDDVRGARLYRLLPNYSFGRQPAFVLYPSRQHLPPRTRVVIDFLVEQLSHTAARLEQDDVWGKSETVWLM